jgi:hypothetical protein
VEDDEDTLAAMNDERVAGLEAEPEGVWQAVSATAEVIPHVMHGAEEFVGAELFKGQSIDEHLSAPAEQETIDGSTVAEAF